MTTFDYILLIIAIAVLGYQVKLLIRMKRDVLIPGVPPHRKTVGVLMALIIVLVLAASVATGYTAQAAIEAIRYYSGIPVGVCSIFACVPECEGFPVISIYKKEDLDGYASYASRECPLCKAGVKLDAMVNSHGISSF